MIKITSIINKNYQDSYTQGAANRQPSYDCKKIKFDFGSSLLWGELVGERYVTFFTFMFISPLSYEYLTPLYTAWVSLTQCVC